MRSFICIAVTVPILLTSTVAGNPLARPRLTPVHTPLHKGTIDLATGLYIRINEDLVVQGSPVLALQRTYVSGHRASYEFGIGASHSGEDYLIGDSQTFQWAALILARGTRIDFKRVTPGATQVNARFAHKETATEWSGAELSWTRTNWTLKKRDGSVLVFRACGKGSLCSIIQSTDPQGRTIHYRRNAAGRLQKMEAAKGRWIALHYDSQGRIERAFDSLKRDVRYKYDARGRLERATGSDGSIRRYGYTDLDELEQIEEPGTSTTNTYQDGRCIRQANWYPERDPYVFEVKYQVDGRRVHRTRISESNGNWREYAWDDRKSSVSETFGRKGSEPVLVMFERDPESRRMTSLTISCRDRQGRPVRQATDVRKGEEELLKRALVKKYCS